MPIITCPKCGAKNRIDDRAKSLQPVCGKCGAKLSVFSSGAKPLVVTDASFTEDVLRADRPVLLDCWAPWCGPCRMIAPIIDQLAAESGGRYVVAKLNTDENRRTASQFRIDAIPTLLIFNHGQLVDRIVGMAPKQAILAKLEQVAAAPA
jgi:thioredoxin 2